MLPVNPVGALIPNMVPNVDHAVLVAPAVSINTNGFVVVEVPPVIGVPVNETAGADRAPFALNTWANENVFAKFWPANVDRKSVV